MTIIIPFVKPLNRPGIPDLNLALRSIEKNLSGYDRIIIIGDRPKGIKNVDFIPYPNHARNRNANIYFKALASPIDRFLYWFDDHILLKPLHVSEIIPHYCGTLEEIIKVKQGFYRNDLLRTELFLKELNLPLLCYDSHTPCILEKQNLLHLSHLDWSRSFSFVMKTLYFNMFGPQGTFLKTSKLQYPYTAQEITEKSLTWLSMPDNNHKGISKFLADMFCCKCNFEQ